MRKHFIYILIFTIGIFYSCQENEGITFSSKASIYFQLTEEYGKEDLDSLSYSFATGIKTIDTFNLNVKVIGEVVDYDRIFKVEVVPELTTATEGEHYAALEENYIIPAGSFRGTVPVVLFNTDTLLRDSTFRIGLRILGSDDFNVGVTEKLEAKLLFSDRLTQPEVWNYLKYYFGEYNRTKHKYFIKIFGRDFPKDRDEFISEAGLWQTYGALLSNYFRDNYPIYDEDGEIVEPW